MNNNSRRKAALEAGGKGVFSETSHIFVGTKDEPLEYTNTQTLRDSYKGKQFQVAGARPGALFGFAGDWKHRYIGEGLPYDQDQVRYKELQPQKPGRGFLTSDYSRRDEFSSTIRTEQYRALLRQEEKQMKRRLVSGEEPPVAMHQEQPRTAVFLYDRVYDLSPPSRAAMHTGRDTANPTRLTKERQYGGYVTTAILAHGSMDVHQLSRPEHAHMAIIDKTFYDRDLVSSRAAVH